MGGGRRSGGRDKNSQFVAILVGVTWANDFKIATRCELCVTPPAVRSPLMTKKPCGQGIGGRRRPGYPHSAGAPHRAAYITDADRVNSEVARLLASADVVARRDHVELTGTLARLCRRGELVALLPGVYTLPHRAWDPQTRAVAACSFDRSAVIVGDAAASLSYWPELVPDLVEVAGRRTTVARPGYRFVQRAIPPALVTHRRGLRLTVPALTALDQVARHGGEGIDRALRSRRTTLPALYEALLSTPLRRGNRDRRLMVLDSRDAPWSEAERLAHRLFRETGITGWSTNVRIDCRGAEYFLDIAFHHSQLAIEIDGRGTHGGARFEDDRRRGNELLLAGKRVLHFTWHMLTEEPGMVIATTRRALALPA